VACRARNRKVYKQRLRLEDQTPQPNHKNLNSTQNSTLDATHFISLAHLFSPLPPHVHRSTPCHPSDVESPPSPEDARSWSRSCDLPLRSTTSDGLGSVTWVVEMEKEREELHAGNYTVKGSCIEAEREVSYYRYPSKRTKSPKSCRRSFLLLKAMDTFLL